MTGAQPVEVAAVECRSADGRARAIVHIYPRGAWNPGQPELAPIFQLPASEARQRGEAEWQLRENGRYEYRLEPLSKPANWHVSCSLAARSAIRSSGEDRGTLDIGAHCGLLRLDVVDEQGSLVASGMIEARSLKLGYRDEYRAMLNDLSQRFMTLLFDARSSSQVTLAPAWRDEPRFLQQQVEFLRETLQSPGFRAAVQRLLAYPHRLLRAEAVTQPIQRPFRAGREINRQFAGGGERCRLPASHPLAARMAQRGIAQPSAPVAITVTRKIDDIDTAENQFVKFALVSFRDFLVRADAALRALGGDWDVVAQYAQRAAHELSQILTCGFFKEISPLRMTPLGSPVLQRKPGYREVFQAWLRFEANARLMWNAADDVFHAGKRDVAALYEYWLFFQLLDWFCERFGGARKVTGQLVEWADGGRVTVKLKRGITAGPFEGEFASAQRRLKAQFHYNRSFTASLGRGTTGSWTRAMRPDYTLTFWPAEYTLPQAEEQELAVHIHFDAKYRVDSLEALFGTPTDSDPTDAETGDEDAGESRGNVKRADLLKMHAYRDAVRRTEGAYVIYPGTDRDRAAQWRPGSRPTLGQNMMLGFHEILPGLGAFAVVPDGEGRASGMSQLAEFLDAVLEHVCNRATQREQRAYHVFDAPRVADVAPSVPRALHELDETGYRAAPPFEHLIIAAWYEPDNIDWMLQRGRVVLRLGARRGSLPIVKELAVASHILLRSHHGATQPGLLRIVTPAGQVLTRQELVDQGYPRSEGAAGDVFAVFHVEPDPAYATWVWDGARLTDAIEAYERRRKPLFAGIGQSSPLPRILSLGDVIGAAV